jgi:hypothetical protein
MVHLLSLGSFFRVYSEMYILKPNNTDSYKRSLRRAFMLLQLQLYELFIHCNAVRLFIHIILDYPKVHVRFNQETRSTYKVTLRVVRVTIVAMEKQ